MSEHIKVSNGDLIDISELNITGKKKATVMYKINTITFICGMALIALFVSFTLVTRIIGGIFIVVVSFIYFRIQNQKIMDIYDDKIVIYDTAEQGKVLVVDLQDLYSFSSGMYDEGFNLITLRTNQGDVIYCETYESNKAVRVLRKLVPEKEVHKQKLDEMQKNIDIKFKKKKK